MAILFENTFEGGTDGVGITTGNSGGASGDAFSSIFNSGSASFVFDDATSAFGALSGNHTVTVSGETSNWRWDHAAETELWCRMYFRISDSTPSSNFPILAWHDNTNRVAELQITTGGNIRLRDNGNTQRYISSGNVAANEWNRVETHVVFNATTGHLEAQIYYGANFNGVTPDETIGNQTDNWDTGALCDNIRGGIISTAGQAIQFWNDNLVIDDAQFPGPVGSAFPAAPGNLTATAVSSSQINLAWDTVTGASAYDIRRQQAGSVTDSGPILVLGHGSTTYNDTGLSPSTQYAYKVRAVE